MNTRLVGAMLAVSSVLIAGVVTGSIIVVVGGLLYRWLAVVASPGIALSCVIFGALLLSALVVLLGHAILKRAFRLPSEDAVMGRSPAQILATELIPLVVGTPARLIAVSLGVGFALGFSPRLRRALFRSLDIFLFVSPRSRKSAYFCFQAQRLRRG